MVIRPATIAPLARPLAMALLAVLALPVPFARAGTVSGPGATHTVQPGDRVEDWFVNDGALLQLLPQSEVLNTFVTDSRMEATDARIDFINARGGHVDIRGGTLGNPVRGGYAALINNSMARLEAVDVTVFGIGLWALRASTELEVIRSTVTTTQIGVDVQEGAAIRLQDVQLQATNTGNGIGIRLADSRATVVDSRIQSGHTGVSMTNSEADIIGSTVAGRTRGVLVTTTAGAAMPAHARLDTTEVTATAGPAVLLSGPSALTLRGSHLQGAGSNGIGVLAQGDITLAAYGSRIEGVLSGLRIETPARSSILLDGTHIVATGGDAIQVDGTASALARIDLRNGTTLAASSGILLHAQASSQVDLRVSASHLVGDLVGQNMTTGLDVTLGDGATLTGRIDGGRAIAIHDAQWQLTGDSTIASLQVGPEAVVALGRGDTFHRLAISDDFTGNGGTLLFNTVLAGDDAATDTLVIAGDTHGTANVRVNNIGGAGAQTTQGIELISVGGASNGQFTLAGRAVGGQYDYFLHKGTGTDGNWYLRSVLPTPPDPCVVDPAACTPPVDPVTPVDPGEETPPPGPDPEPILRPEGGAYVANLRASQDMFRIGYHARRAGQNGGRAWARVDGDRQGFDAAGRQLEIHGNSQALSVGTDLWRAGNGSSVGVMLSSGNATSTSTNPLSGYYARGKVKGEALGLYGTWRGGPLADPHAGFYVDGSVQRARFRNRVEGVSLMAERYGSRAWQGALETGYAFRLRGASSSSLYLEPQLQVGYTRWSDTRHTEANGTVVTTDDADGLFGRAGLRLSGVTRWEGRAAQVQPYLAAHWLHSRADARVRMDGERVEARIPRSRAEVSAGASVTFANGLGVWGGLARQQASGYHLTSAQLGMSYAW
ncbi:autotransporter outer membrane beta-barrel domain-containing protein [Stenotrophomonas sp. 24(2023)]|uniref:autotransporter family protein n=1 Tax=Stenotrophomonas sp. 24(2023) TaxID=3068324 RepID=UPI0027E174CC|nr:autotransporter outer membrane beta-barrel domain-containing protein [Stenotrophomonas sp. 24(2023)]WMJ69370.1 autotransporter outer membrane beta-barrel domain-containing protein [Stenotrophomonas sp. 24(2023)]